jgi:gluconolactonase
VANSRLAISLSALTLLVLSFQNCGPSFSPLAERASSTLAIASPSPTASPTASPGPSPTAFPSNPIAAGAVPTTIATGHNFTEGPVWVGSLNALIYSDIGVNTLFKWDSTTNTTSVFRANASVPNGNLLSDDGFLLTLEGYPQRRIAKTNLSTLATTTLTNLYQGSKFNSPNDLARYKDGSVYMTDPEYGGTPNAEKEMNYRGVFRVMPNGETRLITKDFEQPNGIGFSPDFKSMYVADSGRDEIRKFVLNDAGEVVSASVFYKVSVNDGNAFDGIKVDVAGNVYASGRRGVTVINAAGVKVDFVGTNENTTNIAFGGPSKTTLFITCPTTVRKMEVLIPGM